jgi:hypothetical protein
MIKIYTCRYFPKCVHSFGVNSPAQGQEGHQLVLGLHVKMEPQLGPRSSDVPSLIRAEQHEHMPSGLQLRGANPLSHPPSFIQRITSGRPHNYTT